MNSTRTPHVVVMLGVVSLLTDASSEMIYPLLPAFLIQTLGATPAALGLIEGLAESTSAFLKIVSGSLADRLPRRKPLVVAGYGLAALVRPLVGFAQAWPTVLLIRFTDRVGKGIRSAPRDALLADATLPANRGAAYGVHRALDHMGAVVGPLTAAILISFVGLEYRQVFLIAAIPAAISMAVLIFYVKESDRALELRAAGKGFALSSLRSDWNAMPPQLRILFWAIFLFALGNSSDAFLILRLNEAGIPPGSSAFAWAALHGIKVWATWIGGRMSDRFGPGRMMVLGWTLYAVIFSAYGISTNPTAIISLFFLHGFHFGLVEPSQRALVASLAPQNLRGTAFGMFYFVTGLAALPASLLFGWLFAAYGVGVAFVTGGLLALGACAVAWFQLNGSVYMTRPDTSP